MTEGVFLHELTLNRMYELLPSRLRRATSLNEGGFLFHFQALDRFEVGGFDNHVNQRLTETFDLPIDKMYKT